MPRNSSIRHPLTTTFTPPSDCNNMQFRSGDWGGGTFFFVPEHHVCRRTCYPPQNVDTAMDLYGIFYSPGLLCPSGHTTAGSFFRDGTATTGFFVISSRTTQLDFYPSTRSSYLNMLYPLSTLAVGETGAFCCLFGYDLDLESLPYCWRTINTPTTIGVYGCSGHGGGSAYLFATTTTTITLASNLPFTLSQTVTGTHTASFATLSTTSPIFMHYVVQLQWQQSDLPTVASPTTAPSMSATASSPSRGPEETQSGVGTLSTGAKVGIGVSAGLAGLLALILAVIFIRRYRGGRLPYISTLSHGPNDLQPETLSGVGSPSSVGSGLANPVSPTSVNSIPPRALPPHDGAAGSGYGIYATPTPVVGWTQARGALRAAEADEGMLRVGAGGYGRSELEVR
ncbi:hypothetical protein QBC34DRAFT_147735 [Podospora aff. communis PSN243]|uniref:Uncharacterized protein n=1 Tax=Podospora aff. communis PSN243 TaxID=3040156 RepID=A0AAV9GE73_9PEZI|nr:hypothetical protein QBC34DRAFT_147735 [Podospora aff. communis PSN243]